MSVRVAICRKPGQIGFPLTLNRERLSTLWTIRTGCSIENGRQGGPLRRPKEEWGWHSGPGLTRGFSGRRMLIINIRYYNQLIAWLLRTEVVLEKWRIESSTRLP